MGYTSPLEDTKFVLENLLPAHEDLDDTTIDAVLSEAGKLADNYLAPLNHFGDKNNPVLRQDHEVETPEGFSHAFSEIAKGGWIGVASDSNYDGMGLPARMSAAINEYWHGANMSFALCSLLTQGLIDAFTLVGTEEEKKTYLPKFNSGAWTGTMNLTEPQSGTDLATIKTKAEHDGKNWRIKGQKIYITYGEHNMSENIIHLVLARTEGAPEGIKGISTFIIPKFLKDESGEYTIRNDLKCISIEHKMGIKASPTAVMSYGENEGAIGYMLGEEGRGIEYMFIMMNRARFDVGLQGMAISEAARQKALEYANTRIQGTPINREKGTPIIGHGDVKRLLLSMRSLTEAMRALILVSSEIMERAHNGNEKCKLKDEYEVARLHTSGNFAQTFLNENKNAKLEYYLAPPLFSKKDPETGHLLKRRFGHWVYKVFKVLSYLKFLRGTKLDIFGYTLERKKERALAQKTITTINKISEILNDNNYKKIIEFLDIPLSIKGYGHVKEKNIKIAEEKWDKSFDKILNNQNLKKVS